VKEAIADGICERGLAEHDRTPQYQSGSHPGSGLSTRRTRCSAIGLRSAQTGRIGWIRILLPDGRQRWTARKATDLDETACETGPNRGLPLVSVRILFPSAEYVRARLSSAREEVNGTSDPVTDPAVRTGITGSLADPGPQGMAYDDAAGVAAAGAGIGAAAAVGSGRS
jgi:hypothetical protein